MSSSGAGSHGIFPSPDAAIEVASRLHDPNGLTLQTGLGVEASPSLYDLPEVQEFVERLADVASATVEVQKTLGFLDGGSGNGGVLGMFRIKRASFLREQKPQRTASSISGSSFVDGRYFARQIFLPLIDACIDQVANVSDRALTMFPDNIVNKVHYCRGVRERGGIIVIKQDIESAADSAGEEKRRNVASQIQMSCVSDNNGMPLSSRQRKTIRDSGSSSKSNEKRKRLYELTRQKLEEILVIRSEVLDAWTRAIVEASMNPGPAYLPHPAA